MCNRAAIIFLCFAVTEIRKGKVLWGNEYANVQS